MTRPVLLDCDPGHDDALAILLAHGCAELELKAITAVAGNQTLAKTALNARRVASLAGIRGVPVAAGCDRPLLRELATAAGIHGESGLDGVDWPEPDVPLSRVHAVDLIIEQARSSGGELTLIPTGPLTNIALALRREPRLPRWVREVVLMGGAFTRGNVTPAAEFNIAVDPEAAAIVFEADWPVTMVGLDLTHQALAGPRVRARIRALDTPVGRAVDALLSNYAANHRREGHTGAPPVHDPCAVAAVARPELVRCEPAEIRVETRGELTSGMTVVDFTARPGRAEVATRLDRTGFWDLMLSALAGPA